MYTDGKIVKDNSQVVYTLAANVCMSHFSNCTVLLFLESTLTDVASIFTATIAGLDSNKIR